MRMLQVHTLEQLIRISAADLAVRTELPPPPAAVFAVTEQVAEAAGGAARVTSIPGGGGGESDAAVLVEAELILYGGAGRYRTARRRLAKWYERDVAARSMQRKALHAICKPRPGRQLAAFSFGKDAAAMTIQDWWRSIMKQRRIDDPERFRRQRREARLAKRGERNKETFEVIIRRLRMTMYVRKIQMLFRSPQYQRQAYLRRKACLKLQALLRQRQARKFAEARAKAAKERRVGIVRRLGGMAHFEAVEIIHNVMAQPPCARCPQRTGTSTFSCSVPAHAAVVRPPSIAVLHGLPGGVYLQAKPL